MKNNSYESRREQNAAFAREFCHAAKLRLNKQKMAMLREALKDAAVCGAFEERSRVLTILRDMPGIRNEYEQITSMSNEEVLGYRSRRKK